MSQITKLKKLLLEQQKQNTYFHIHGGDVVTSILSVVLIFSVFSFISLKKMSVKLKKNWPKHKCDPGVMPFAGFLNPPPNSNFKDKLDYTMKNYEICSSDVLSGTVSSFTSPIAKLQNGLRGLFDILLVVINRLRTVFDSIKDSLRQILENLLMRLFNIITELTLVLVKVKNSIMTMAGTMAGLFLFGVGLSMTTILFLNNLVGVFAIFLTIITVSMFVSLGIAYIFSAAWPAYLVAFIIWLITSTPIIVAMVFAGTINAVRAEQERRCFHPNTPIKTLNREIQQIKNIKIGDVLDDNNVVEAVIKIKGSKNPLYSYNGVFVTGEHYVYDEEEGWKMVKDTKKAYKTTINTEYYYCLVTKNKTIKINNTIFCDWDDLDKTDIMQIKNDYKLKYFKQLNDSFNSSIEENTILKLNNGTYCKIKNIKIGDILEDNNAVIAKIKCKKPDTITRYINKNKAFYGKNIYLKNLGDCNKVTKEPVQKERLYFMHNFYHLITEKDYIKINGVEYGDYNWIYDNIVDNKNKDF